MTNATTTTPQDIRSRIGDAERCLQEAESALGSVVLDGGDEQAASERVASSRAALERLKAALIESEERSIREQEAESRRREAHARWAVLVWYAEYVERLVPVLRLREELDEAEERVIALGSVMAAARRGSSSFDQWFGNEMQAGRLPQFGRLPQNAVASPGEPRFHRPRRAEDALLTAEECAQWSKKFAPLVKQAAKPLGAAANPADLPWE
jgi:hypothetical protein